jgi:hypothetical protein
VAGRRLDRQAQPRRPHRAGPPRCARRPAQARGPAAGALVQAPRRLQPARSRSPQAAEARRGPRQRGQPRAERSARRREARRPHPRVPASHDAAAEARPHRGARWVHGRGGPVRRHLRRGGRRRRHEVERTGTVYVLAFDAEETIAGQKGSVHLVGTNPPCSRSTSGSARLLVLLGIIASASLVAGSLSTSRPDDLQRSVIRHRDRLRAIREGDQALAVATVPPHPRRPVRRPARRAGQLRNVTSGLRPRDVPGRARGAPATWQSRVP